MHSFIESRDQLPNDLDLVIVASSSKERAEIVSSLIQSKSVKSLLLEKILFQDLKSYKTIAQLLHQHRIPPG